MAPKSNPGGSPNSYVFPGDTIILDGGSSGPSSAFYSTFLGGAYYGDKKPDAMGMGGLIAGSDVGGADIFYGVAGEDSLAFGESDAMSGSSRGGNDTYYGAGFNKVGGAYDIPVNEFYGEARLMQQSSRGGDDRMESGVNSEALLVGDGRFMFDSSRGGNDVIQGGQGQSNWVGEDTFGPSIYSVSGGCNDLFGDAIFMGISAGEDGFNPDIISDALPTHVVYPWIDNNVLGGNDSITGGNAVVTSNDLNVAASSDLGDIFAVGAFVHNSMFGDAAVMGGHATGGADRLQGGNASSGLITGYATTPTDALVINEMYGDGFVMAHLATGGADTAIGGNAATADAQVVNIISGDAYEFSRDTTYSQNIKGGADNLQGGSANGTSDSSTPSFALNVIAGDTFLVGEDMRRIPGGMSFGNDVIRGGNLNSANGSYGLVNNYLFGDVGASWIASVGALVTAALTDDWLSVGATLETYGLAHNLLDASGCADDPFSAADTIFNSFRSGGFDPALSGFMFASGDPTKTVQGGNDTIYAGSGDGFDRTKNPLPEGSPYGVNNALTGDALVFANGVRGGADNLYGGNSRGAFSLMVGDAFDTFGTGNRGGADRIFSGAGVDLMAGDFVVDEAKDNINNFGGADTFVFRTNCNNDYITDFIAAEGDKIDLTGFSGGGKQKGLDPYLAFKSLDALKASGRIIETHSYVFGAGPNPINGGTGGIGPHLSGVLINLDVTGYNSNWATNSLYVLNNSVFIEGADLDTGNILTSSNFFFA